MVYRHIRLDTNEVFYVGIGKGNRPYHKRRNRIWNSITKRTDYRVDVIFDDMTREEACEKEREFIALYGRIDLKTGTLANLTAGGDGGDLSEETKSLLSNAAKQQFGSEDTRAAQSQLMKEYYANNPEFSKEQSKKLKELYSDPMARERIKNGLKRYYQENEDAGIKNSNAVKAYYNKPGSKEKLSNEVKQWHANNPDIAKQHAETLRGRKWMTNGLDNKQLKPELVNSYLEMGWRFGQTRHPKS